MKSRLVITAEQKYKVFEETIDSVAIQMIAAFLYKQHLKGYRKKRIQREFEEIMSILECPEIFGKSLEGLEIAEMMITKYGINFDRVILKHESLEEWTKSYKEAQKNVR